MLENAIFLLDHSEMSGDPLTDFLALANTRCVMSGALAAGDVWSLRFPPPGMIKLVAVSRGACWLTLDGEPGPLLLETGDVVMLPADRAFGLASDLDIPSADGGRVFADAMDNVVTLGEGAAFLAVGGHVVLDPGQGASLADVLPPFLHIRRGSPEAPALTWLLDQLVAEVSGDRPAARLAADQLAQLVFVQILRAYLTAAGSLPPGWTRALNDPRIAPALRMMHREPAHPWRLEELAKAVGMSRTSFAVRFKAAAGVAPLTYLLNWRMRLAERELQTGSAPVGEVALSVGYGSESAFSNAFKRATGLPPKRYRSAFEAAASPRDHQASRVSGAPIGA
jgi:AraC-like DNA-binding protein